MKKWLLVFLFLILPSLHAADSIAKYILPEDHFLQKPLAIIFQDPEIIASRESLQEAGFELFTHQNRGLAVARHPMLMGHLVKVFVNDVPHDKQLQNYVTRIEGAIALRGFIKKESLEHIEVPRKWLYPLKENTLGVSYVLVVEEVDLLSSAESKELYAEIDSAVLKDLCMVLRKFRGLDSIVNNMPFTRGGQIAFIDTEKWRIHRSGFLHYIKPLLDEERLALMRMYAEKESLDDWLLPEDHPLHDKLEAIFTDPEIFDSPESLFDAGFTVNKRVGKVYRKLMAFTHPDVPEYIFKKYQNKELRYDQLEKYLVRLKGAKAIREAIKEHNLTYIVAPQKWLYRLPYSSSDYLVIAEKFDICPGDDSKHGENVRRYQTMGYKTLTELCIIMQALGGCDAWPRNQPFTKQGKIAFIDTEHVGRKENHFAKHILPLLDEKKRAYAQKLLNISS